MTSNRTSNRELHFGVTLPQIKRTWQEIRSAVTAFDENRYDSVWVCDHLYGVPIPTLPILEAWSLLAAVASITEHVQLGTLVTPPFFRNPAVLANQIATIDQISSGRTIPGLGAGWFKPEFEALGCAFPSLAQRMEALEETAQILIGMFTQERFTLEGRHWSVTDAICEPKPVRRPPILIGGTGEKVLMGIVARHADIWNNMATTQSQLGHKIEALKRRCDEEKRDFGTLSVSQQCVIVIAETDEQARTSLAKAQRVYGGHLGAGLEEHGIWGTPARVIDCIERHVKLGCTGFVIEFFGRDTRVPAQLFASEVMSVLRG